MATRSVEDRVMEVVLDELGSWPDVDAEAATLDSDLREDLGMDSLDHVEVTMAVEEEFGISIPDERANAWRTVRDIVATVRQADQAGGGW